MNSGKRSTGKKMKPLQKHGIISPQRINYEDYINEDEGTEGIGIDQGEECPSFFDEDEFDEVHAVPLNQGTFTSSDQQSYIHRNY
jgi:hypothetical protein